MRNRSRRGSKTAVPCNARKIAPAQTCAYVSPTTFCARSWNSPRTLASSTIALAMPTTTENAILNPWDAAFESPRSAILPSSTRSKPLSPTPSIVTKAASIPTLSQTPDAYQCGDLDRWPTSTKHNIAPAMHSAGSGNQIDCAPIARFNSAMANIVISPARPEAPATAALRSRKPIPPLSTLRDTVCRFDRSAQERFPQTHLNDLADSQVIRSDGTTTRGADAKLHLGTVRP